MLRYAKIMLPMVSAAVVTLIAVMSDDQITLPEWLMVASAALGTYVGVVTPTTRDRENG